LYLPSGQSRLGKSMKIDALVLAGGKVEGFDIENRPPIKALLDLDGRPMIEYVLEALSNSENVGQIVVLTPMKMEDESWAALADNIIYIDDIITANITKGLDNLGPDGKFLLISSDIPLLTTKIIDDFISDTLVIDAEVYYPIVTKKAVEARFPKSKRTYFSLKDGTYTGGNIFLIDKIAFRKNKERAEQIFANRKRPLKMVGLIGISNIIKFLLKRMTIEGLEAKASSILACKARAIVTDHAEVGVDIDKQEDLDMFKQKMAAERELFR